jgi:hypothetical protein
VIAAISDIDLDWRPEIINRRYPDGNLKLSNFDGSYHVLLADLSQSHYCNKDIKPTLEHALTVATELATLHAFNGKQKPMSRESRQIRFRKFLHLLNMYQKA